MEQTDLLIVGAGPAGMAAAVTARRLGLSVIIADENAEPGGQIYRRVLSNSERPRRFRVLGADYLAGHSLARAFVASGADWRPQTTVFEIAEDGSASLVAPGRGAYPILARAVLIANGAYERALPVPGWTLPGVMTAGAAQTLLKTSGHVPTGRIVLAGGGPLLWYTAWQLRAAGAEIGALLSFTPAADYLHLSRTALAAWRNAGDLAKGAKWIAAMHLGGVSITHGARLISIEGQSPNLRVRYESSKGNGVEEAATVLLHAGIIPDIQASKSLRLEHDWDTIGHSWRPRVNAWCVSSQPTILIAGDGAGISGAKDAERAGQLAALGLAERLGRITANQRDAEGTPLLSARAREKKLRTYLDQLFMPPDWVRVPVNDATLVCRCEEITAAQIRAAVRLGATGPNQVKAYTRAGMGNCQGRMCAHATAAIIAHEMGVSADQVATQQVRPPLKPVHLSDLAAMDVGVPEQGSLSISDMRGHASSTMAGAIQP